jgi:hypothetical protein
VGRRLTDEERAFRAVLEKPFQRRIVRYAKKHGWRVVAFHASVVSDERSTQGGESVWVLTFATAISADAKGFPDLSLYRPGDAPIYAEVKRELGRLSPEQVAWLALLDACGQVAVVWRPSDWLDIREVLR